MYRTITYFEMEVRGRVESSLMVGSKDVRAAGHSHICLCHAVTRWSYWKNNEKIWVKASFKRRKIRFTLMYCTCEIPVIPRCRYVVCRGVPKTNTIPVPVAPVTRSPRVFPYPCHTLPPYISSIFWPQWCIRTYWLRSTDYKCCIYLYLMPF